METLGVGRSSVREAVKGLESAIIGEDIKYIDQQTLDHLGTLLTAWSDKASTGGVLEEYDKAFHKTLYRRLANDTLENILEVFWVTLYAMSPELKSVDKPRPDARFGLSRYREKVVPWNS